MKNSLKIIPLILILICSCNKEYINDSLNTAQLVQKEFNSDSKLISQIISTYAPNHNSRAIVDKSLEQLDLIDAYLLLMTNGFSKEIYQSAQSKTQQRRGLAILNAARSLQNRSQILDALQKSGLQENTILLLEELSLRINESSLTYDEASLYERYRNLHKLGLLDKNVIPLNYGARESLWDYAKVVIKSTAVLIGGCASGPIGCGAAIVIVGIDVYDFACEINGCQ